jgi:hypothetical protein
MTVPRTLLEFLNFCDQHARVWSDRAASLGLTTLEAQAFENAYTLAKSKYDAHQQAIAASRGAAEVSAGAIRDLRRSAADTIRLIRAFAAQQDKPATIYAMAEIPSPATPSPLPPPGSPFDFRAELNPIGSITLRWKCEAPGAGTVYLIRRRLASESAFRFLNAAGGREFTDAGVPVGAVGATYIINGQRTTVTGADSLPFSIMFGVAGGGGLSIAPQGVEGASGVKMAA